ncbi:MAG: hypothetical protein H0W97_02900 [Actinobacteria bacterium]|nr:hypothetical protein [Actinomycetota bacterium]
MTDYSRGDMSYAVRLANRGYDVDMIFRALATKPSGRRDPGSLKYQRLMDTKGRDVADAYARQTAEKAIAFIANSPRIIDRTDALVRITEIKALADALPWGLYAGPGARRALEAAFSIAERVGGLAFGLSLREWSETCGQDLRMTRTNRDLLVRLGWLLRNPDDRLGRTARFRLRTPPHIHSHGRYECASYGAHAWLAHDAFREEGLGNLGWYVLSLTDSRPLALHELSIRSGVDLAELEDLIGIMTHADLVVGDDQVGAVPDLTLALDHFAQGRGTLGRGEADRAQYQRDREAFRARGVNVRTLQEAR